MNIDEMLKLLTKEEDGLQKEIEERTNRIDEIKVIKKQLEAFSQLNIRCDKCGGFGKVFRRACAEDDGDYYTCDKCNGQGILRP